MASIVQYVRDTALYSYGYSQGRWYAFPRSFADAYGLAASKLSSFIALPLPLVSFLALPLFGGTSTSINIAFFYLTWSALILSHDQLSVEIWGTLAIKLLCYLLPALGFLGFDCFVPNLAKSVKAEGAKALPQRLGREKLVRIVAVATFNVLLSVALQALLELLATQILHTRSILRVTTTVPLPWTMGKDVLKGLLLRGLLHYFIHRHLLHTYDSPLKRWHLQWQHSVKTPFSLIAAYDQPVDYLLANWLPLFLPAYLFRFHVLTWHVMLALASLEDLFVYSGYAVLPSSIILAGMARRTDAHFLSAKEDGEVGNYGHWGIMDLACSSSCRRGNDALDDIQDEADKHNLQERLSDAADGVKDGLEGREKSRSGEEAQSKEEGQAREEDQVTDEDQVRNEDQGQPADQDRDAGEDGPSSNVGKRRSNRKKAQKE